MADRGYGARSNDVGREAKVGLLVGAVLTLGTVIAILAPTVGPSSKRRWR